MHHLEVLYLSDAFVPEEDVSLPDHFVLPKLREVSIKHVSPEPLSLLRGIEAPKITSVDIQIPSTPSQWGTITSLADVQSIFSFASFTPPSLQKPSNHHLEISRSIFTPFLSIFYTQCDGDGNPSKALRILKCDMSLDIVWTIIHREKLRSFSLVLTPEAIPLQIENFNTISSLADSRNLAILQVPYLCFADIGLLATWTSSSAFPHLSSLTLDCLHRKPKNITFLKLKDWLIAREEQGLTALESLQISRCPHHRAVIAGMLKVLVEQLEISCRPLRPPNSIVPSVSYNVDENVYS
ncbi:hypothetical protein ONZ45_g3638 [Pleurotus djamor]|nr:hypothetical protein ONZ45_g3638 [Pleurotus djamor]